MRYRPTLTEEELYELVREAYAKVAACRTVEELRGVWLEYYDRIGHKALARMLLGWPPERIAKKAKAGLVDWKRDEE